MHRGVNIFIYPLFSLKRRMCSLEKHNFIFLNPDSSHNRTQGCGAATPQDMGGRGGHPQDMGAQATDPSACPPSKGTEQVPPACLWLQAGPQRNVPSLLGAEAHAQATHSRGNTSPWPPEEVLTVVPDHCPGIPEEGCSPWALGVI